MKRAFIVAEIGCNHNGNKELAKRMVLEAKKCNVDAVKFQTFRAKNLISKFAPKADYQKKTTGILESQLEMTKKLELSQNDFLELREFAVSLGLNVFSTPFDSSSIDFLESTGQRMWKIPSGEITNLPYLERIGEIKCENKKIIISTGMATKDEVKNCVNLFLKAGTKRDEIVILQCNTEYPTPDKDMNILAINDLKRTFPEFEVGFSDHSVGYIAAVGATVLGVSMIEKHFTLDKDMTGPDHKASATPEEMKALVKNVRRIEKMLGNGIKVVTESERKNKIVARKSIVAKKSIKMGEIFTGENIICKRPGNGISPMEWYNILGNTAERDFEEDELIESKNIAWQEEI